MLGGVCLIRTLQEVRNSQILITICRIKAKIFSVCNLIAFFLLFLFNGAHNLGYVQLIVTL